MLLESDAGAMGVAWIEVHTSIRYAAHRPAACRRGYTPGGAAGQQQAQYCGRAHLGRLRLQQGACV